MCQTKEQHLRPKISGGSQKVYSSNKRPSVMHQQHDNNNKNNNKWLPLHPSATVAPLQSAKLPPANFHHPQVNHLELSAPLTWPLPCPAARLDGNR